MNKKYIKKDFLKNILSDAVFARRQEPALEIKYSET